MKQLTQMMESKKGALTLGDAPEAVRLFIIIGVTLAVGALILTVLMDQTTSGTTAESVVNSSLAAFLTFGNFQGLLAIAVIASIVLGLIVLIGVSR